MVSTDTGYAPTRWAFDDEVSRVFDNMLERSIPQLDVMRQACFDLACRYREHGTMILDLGCSRGDALAPLIDKWGMGNRYLGIEVSQPMLQACRERFTGAIQQKIIEIKELDLRSAFPPILASVTQSILTLMFIPLEYRQRLVQRIYDHLLPGGAFLIVEKILGSSDELNTAMVDLYHRLKHDHGYSAMDIERKRLALEGVLVPVTASWNEEMLRMAGFHEVDCFWRWMNFAGWIAVKRRS
jgi:tRNA (cmo5U34)-methyltransferase